jgi:hypothetical protein
LTESIRSIFETNIDLLGNIDKAIFYFREQQYDKALGIAADSIDQINHVLEAIIKDREYFNLVDTESMLEMLTGILSSQKNKDYILLADLLELQLVNFLIGVQELIIGKEEIIFNEDKYYDNIKLILERGIGIPELIREPMDTPQLLEKGYRVEFTSCGLMTLAGENEGEKFYFHTNNKILTEAFLLARHWYAKNTSRYIIYGLGMGYHIQELIRLAEEAEIEVYEADQNVMKLACAFANIGELLTNERIKLIFDPEFKLVENRIADLKPEEVFLVHYPSYKNIKNADGKKIIETKLSCPELINI